MMDSLSDVLWDAAIDLAVDRGCFLENHCWQDCIDTAYYSLLEGQSDE